MFPWPTKQNRTKKERVKEEEMTVVVVVGWGSMHRGEQRGGKGTHAWLSPFIGNMGTPPGKRRKRIQFEGRVTPHHR